MDNTLLIILIGLMCIDISEAALPAGCDAAEVACPANSECDSGTKVCECNDGFKLNAEQNGCVAKAIGDICDGSNGCTGLANTECTSGSCECETGFAEKDDICTKTVSGTTCNAGGKECDKIANSACASGGSSCLCNYGFKESIDICTKVIGGSCPSGTTCPDLVENTVCTQGKCECDEHFEENNNACVRTVSGTTCSENGQECDKIDNSHCDNGKCKCDAGYVMNVNACSVEKSAASIQLGTLTVLLSGLAALIQKFW